MFQQRNAFFIALDIHFILFMTTNKSWLFIQAQNQLVCNVVTLMTYWKAAKHANTEHLSMLTKATFRSELISKSKMWRTNGFLSHHKGHQVQQTVIMGKLGVTSTRRRTDKATNAVGQRLVMHLHVHVGNNFCQSISSSEEETVSILNRLERILCSIFIDATDSDGTLYVMTVSVILLIKYPTSSLC